MTTPLCRSIASLVILVGFAFFTLAPAVGAKTDLPEGAAALLDVGKAGPKAITLNIRTDKPEGYTFKPGDSLVLHVKASKDAYLTAVYISSKGDAVVLFPNNEKPSGFIAADKEFTLFGEDCSIKLTINEKMKEGQIVFYLASVPLNLDPLKAAEGRPCVQISSSDNKDLGILKEKLEGLAKDEGFNRLVMHLKTESKSGVSPRLMGLPTAIKSEKPETITGVQGAKPEQEKPE